MWCVRPAADDPQAEGGGLGDADRPFDDTPVPGDPPRPVALTAGVALVGLSVLVLLVLAVRIWSTAWI